MGLDISFYKKNPLYSGKKYDSENIGNEILYFRKAYFVQEFIDIKNCEYVDVTKEQFYEMLSFMKKWRVCFDTNDFSEIPTYNLWMIYKSDDSDIKGTLDMYIPEVEEIYNDFDWENDVLTVFASY